MKKDSSRFVDELRNIKGLVFSHYTRKAFFSYYLSQLNFVNVHARVHKEWGDLKGPKNLLKPDMVESTEKPVLDLLKQLHVQGICIDIGAWIGYYSLLLAKTAKMVFAVEPDPRNIRYLRHNIEVNSVKNVRILPFALDVEDGDSRLVLAPMSSGNSLYATGYTRMVKTTSLNTLLANVPESHVDLIKMDIEGAEYPIILNLDRKVFDRVKQWVVECHKKDREEEIQRIFEANGYVVKWFKDNNNGLTDHIYATHRGITEHH